MIIRRLVSFSLVFAVTLSSVPYFAFAQEITPEQAQIEATRNFYADNDITYHDYFAKETCVVTTAASTGPASGLQTSAENNQNLIAIYNYFLTKGLKDIHAAAIVGNIYQESGGNPLIKQGGTIFDGDLSTVTVGWGLVQWTPGSKVPATQQAAGVQGDIKQLGVQLDVIWWQLQNTSPTGRNNVLGSLQATTSVEAAVRIFSTLFEGAGDPQYANRDAAARKALTYPVDPAAAAAAGAGLIRVASGGSNCPGGAGAAAGALVAGQVSADGYAFPLALPKDQIYNWYQWPCPGICHHDNSGAMDLSKSPISATSGVGTPVLAITTGTVTTVKNNYSGQAGCSSFHIVGEKDGWDYYYTHIQNPPSVGKIDAGQQIAVIGEQRCTGNGSPAHLHIERGRNSSATVAGRDPNFPQLINKLYAELP